MATRVLLCYHSAEGQTAKIADRIAEILIGEGCSVVVARAGDDPSPAGYDGVVVGDSIHAGRHSRQLRRWIGRHGDELDAVPVALFQVSLTSRRDDEEGVAEAHRLLQHLLDATDLDPDLVGLFAGALAYTRYGWFKRRMMSRIAESEGGDSDPSRDYEYTDWDAVDHFAADALAVFGGHGARPSQ